MTTLDKEKYGVSEHGNFRVIDTIGVPHPYCIGAKHVTFAADKHGGMLGKEVILAGEKQGIVCEICKGKLPYEDHKTALLVECAAELKSENNVVNPELHAYLLKAKPLCEADGYVGFAFVQKKGAK